MGRPKGSKNKPKVKEAPALMVSDGRVRAALENPFPFPKFKPNHKVAKPLPERMKATRELPDVKDLTSHAQRHRINQMNKGL